MQDTGPDTNLYAPPVSGIRVEAPTEALQAHTFYVVSVAKFCVLYVATFGIYGLYWFYMHWQRYRRGHGRHESIWPVPRAFFSIFFAHALVARIEAVLGRDRSDVRWSPGLLATTYVIFEIASNILGRLDGRGIGSPATGILAIAAIAPIALALLQIQGAANHACGDPDGGSNRRFTWANVCWIALGLAVWTLVLIGIFLPA